MKRISITSLMLVAGIACGGIHTAAADTGGTVRVPGGEFIPLYGPGGSKLPVRLESFRFDQTPATREQFASFLAANAQWRPGKVKRVYAESGYLEGWKNGRVPKGTSRYPVVNVSYFAAAAYCEWKKGRLPTVMEWEYVAQAADVAEGEEILRAVSAPAVLKAVGGKVNRYGIRDLHGLVWEWTMDYNSAFVTSDNRQDGEMTKNFFCGGSAISAADRMNYPAFLRYAMRGGLKPDFTIANTGFRCAYDSN